jgi:Kef-type K+ transport system membrane component KefB
MEVEFGYGGLLFFVALFVITGASLDLRAFAAAWGAALAFALARFLGKSIGLFVFAPASGLRFVQAAQLSVAMTPMAALAIGLTWSIADLSPELGAQLVAIVVAAVTLLHLIGPIATQAALKWAREATPGAGGR